jgi:uncharacterized membrane protein YfcA
VNTIVAFASTFLLDLAWVFYTRTIAAGRVYPASLWSAVIYAMGALVVLSYVNDHWAIIGAMGGAFCGTWTAMRFVK